LTRKAPPGFSWFTIQRGNPVDQLLIAKLLEKMPREIATELAREIVVMMYG
jgi:hypothetical protein